MKVRPMLRGRNKVEEYQGEKKWGRMLFREEDKFAARKFEPKTLTPQSEYPNPTPHRSFIPKAL